MFASVKPLGASLTRPGRTPFPVRGLGSGAAPAYPHLSPLRSRSIRAHLLLLAAAAGLPLAIFAGAMGYGLLGAGKVEDGNRGI